MKDSYLKRLGSSLLTGAMILSCTMSVLAASSVDNNNNTATVNDLINADIIDTSKSGSISIYKYDITSAEAAGAYTAGERTATGEKDAGLEEILADYAVEGVEFTYLRCGEIETYSYTDSGSEVEIVYEIPDALRSILGLDTADAVDMSAAGVAVPCSRTDVCHYTSQQLNDNLKDILETDNISAKDELESYVINNHDAVKMTLTDKNGFTGASDLELGLYLLVETKVPEQVVGTCNPWFVSLPFTNEGGSWNDSEGGQQWLYDMICYPKNQTGNPTLDKMVRNAHGEAAEVPGEYEDFSYLVYNKADSAAGVEVGSDTAFVDARDEYIYASTGTASEGDILDYILVSRLPHIEDSSTYLTEYTFLDTLSKGLTYNKDVKIAFYNHADDAKANNTEKAEAIWTNDEFEQGYANILVNDEKTGETTLTVRMTEKGLALINDPHTGYADHYMVVYYSVTVNSDATVVLGDEGNPNDVTLTWRRTSDAYYNTLEDKCEVYTFGLNLTKSFSDNNGDASKVQFKLYNTSDAYYVVADEAEAGLYYVTGKTASEDSATVFSPAADGKLLINGIEGDTYQLTEIATDNGYSLLKDQITIVINSTSEIIIPSVAGTTGLEAATTAGQNIDRNYAGGIVDATGTNVSVSKGDQASETANGRTIGKTAMYEGEKVCAAATVDGVDAAMSTLDGSDHARVDISILNSRTFLLPQTGGAGLYLVTILGVVIAAFGCTMYVKKKKEA